jgi:hypothetical protein
MELILIQKSAFLGKSSIRNKQNSHIFHARVRKSALIRRKPFCSHNSSLENAHTLCAGDAQISMFLFIRVSKSTLGARGEWGRDRRRGLLLFGDDKLRRGRHIIAENDFS